MGHTAPQLHLGSTAHRVAPPLIGEAACMHALRAIIAAVGRRNSTVLVCGESGSGKELVARLVHAAGPRAEGPFVAVDCTSLRDTLFESQLFGHVRGAFTGAEQATIGFFRAAGGGTLFLDEIGELPLHVQAKLLRCIQEGVVVPLGSVEPIPVDVRIVAATHRDLQQMVRAGTFREDLYYRLNVVRIQVPPLRARPEDILPLAEWFLQQQAALYQEPRCALTAEAGAALQTYDWPGNARELSNAIEHGCAFCTDRMIRLADLPESVRLGARGAGALPEERVLTLEDAEQLAITRALRASRGNRAKAAQLLQIERHRLYRKIRRYRLHQISKPVCE
jgi:transcriptional regulator with PAS, ATPase and Fis domain